MKKLQNDFTTPEQSKRLLELGVPADSANCYYTQEEIEGNMYWFDLHIKRDYQPHSSLHASTIWKETLPCWSVGRLIEIMQICSIPVTTWYIKSDSKQPVLEFLFNDLETSVIERNINFSKLEEYK